MPVIQKIKDSNSLTGRGRTTYLEVYEILGGWPAYHPTVVLDTAHYALLVEGGQDGLSDGNEDMLENEKSLEP